eukprot:11058376-Lingulodinium_polyedra.AAC.1
MTTHGTWPPRDSAAATKERFQICVGTPVPRHAPLPQDCQLLSAHGNDLWLGVLPQQPLS